MKKILVIVFSVVFIVACACFVIFKNIHNNYQNIFPIPKINKDDNKNINKNESSLGDDSCRFYYKESFLNKTFICFPPYCYDINSFTYNKLTDTYNFDYIIENDPGGDSVLTNCPYDDGYITHLIFNTDFSTSKKIFNIRYKGFISSKIVEKEGILNNKYLNIYYDTSNNIIPNMQYYINLYKDIEREFESSSPSSFFLITSKCFLKLKF